MAVPNLEHIVRRVRDSRVWDFSTKAGLCAYTNACVVALHAEDREFGHLSKSEGQNHCVDPRGRLTAADVALYKISGQVVDFIGSAGFYPDGPPHDEDGHELPMNPVTWGVGPDGEYGADRWFEPVSGEPLDPADDEDDTPWIDVPPLPGTTHIANLEAGIENLVTLHKEVAGQLGTHNEQIADLTTRVHALEHPPTVQPPAEPVTPPVITIPRPSWLPSWLR